MKFTKMLIALLLSLFILQGCNGDDTATPPPENVPVEQEDDQITDNQNNQTTTGESTTENLFDFTSFDLDVDYEGNKTYEADYENEVGGMEAKIKDNLNNEALKGDEAFKKLRPIFEQLTFNQTTPNEEVISEVLKEFELNDDFVKFELDVEFSDGTEKEYNSIKK